MQKQSVKTMAWIYLKVCPCMEEKIISREKKVKVGENVLLSIQGDDSSWASRPGRQGGEMGGYPGVGGSDHGGVLGVFWGWGESQRNVLPCIEHVFLSYFVCRIANMNLILIFPSHQRKGRATPTLFKFVLFL